VFHGTQTALCHPLFGRYGLALTTFATWRVDISHIGAVGLGRNIKIVLKVRGH